MDNTTLLMDQAAAAAFREFPSRRSSAAGTRTSPASRNRLKDFPPSFSGNGKTSAATLKGSAICRTPPQNKLKPGKKRVEAAAKEDEFGGTQFPEEVQHILTDDLENPLTEVRT